MSWITLTTDHIKARLSLDEIAAYTDAAGQNDEGGVDILAGIIGQVTGLVRSKVASHRENLPKMGTAGTIPDECLFAACTIARDSLPATLPLSEGATELRKEELRKAHQFLDDVAAGKVRIEDAAGELPEADTSETTSPTYGGSPLLDF